MNSKLTDLGKEGEQLATLFLENKGYIVLNINYRYKHYEVDVIAKKGNLIIFAEVKRRNSKKFGFPEQFVNHQKKKNLKECANHYMSLIKELTPLRFDIISIYWPDGCSQDEADIIHFEDAFY